MKKIIILGLIFMFLAGCASTNSAAMWRRGDWNGSRIKWVGETYLDGDTPETIIKTTTGEIIIFQ